MYGNYENIVWRIVLENRVVVPVLDCRTVGRGLAVDGALSAASATEFVDGGPVDVEALRPLPYVCNGDVR